MGKRKKYEEEKFTFNYPEDGDDVWTKNLDSRDMEKRLKKIAKKEKKKAKKEKKKIEKAERKAQQVDLNNQFMFAQAEAKVRVLTRRIFEIQRGAIWKCMNNSRFKCICR